MGETSERNGAGAEPLPWRAPLALFGTALVVYWVPLWLHTGTAFPQSQWPYFVYYAAALLQGRLDFSVMPPGGGLDIAVFDGGLYMPFPPFPSVPFLPWVAAFGVGASDRFACVLLSAANGPLLYAALARLDRSGLVRVPERARLFLCVFFLFGTLHLSLAIASNLWGFAHIVCNTLVLASLWALFSGRPLLAAVALVGVLFTRSHVVLVAAGLLGVQWLLWERAGTQTAARLRTLAAGAAILASGAALLLAFNYARFGDVFETGLTYHHMHPIFRQRFDSVGAFHPSYLPRNLGVMLLGMPIGIPRFPWFSFSPAGLSLFVASPLYLALFRSLRAPHRKLAVALWCGVILVAIPVLLFMGTGELQFGYRYLTDVQALLVLLTFLGLGAKVTRTGWALLGVSIAMNAYGAWWFVTRYAG